MNLAHVSHDAMPWLGLTGIAAGVVITGILPLFVDSSLLRQEDGDYLKRMMANERMIPARLLTARGRSLSRIRYGCLAVGFAAVLAIILRT